ncbi:MAG: leucine-rich repeat protein [Ruminococcus sp.]|nr:leucine-rich repeat protein [Ruminococcus sp.]
MKQIASVFLALLLIFCAVTPGFAADADIGDWQYTVENGEAIITAYHGAETSPVVPSALGGHEVVAIGTAAFYRSKIESVTLPSTVRSIGWWAFYGASKLTEVRLAEGLQSISFGAFLNCPKLHSVSLPPTVHAVGEDAFAVSCETEMNIEDEENERTVSRQTYSVDNGFVITGYYGTAAEYYAQEHGLTFKGEDILTFGDVNLDDTIDNKDIVLLENYIYGGTISHLSRLNADLNSDGKADDADLRLLRSYIAGEISLRDLPANSFKPVEQSYLSGKTLYSDGDSVAKGTGTDTFGSGFRSYAHWLAEKYEMRLTSKAIGGTTLAKVKNNPLSSESSILERVLSMKGHYDVILLDGGFNDIFIKAKLGTVTPDTDKSGKYDTATTIGALETICYFLTKNYNDAVKLFVLCHDCGEDAQTLYFDNMRRVLDKWEIPYVDISEETDFRAVNKEINNQYFFANDSQPVGDQIHPLAYAQEKVYGALIERKLNAVFAEKNRLAAENETLAVAPGESVRLSLQEGEQPYDGAADWTSSQEETVSVSDGVLTANAIGEAMVRAETPDGQIAAVRVDVKRYPLCFYLNYTGAVLVCNQQFSLVPVFLEGTAARDFSYQTSDAAVAQVSDDGTVTAQSGGSAVITCKLSNGVKTACLVHVK